ncbi:MAG: hypothetical protein IJ233_10735 [Pyramidobacter sp.]|nr:hypothetical protein [Pyramidobacter sp.]
MSPRARKILLAAALFCSCAAAFAFRRRYRPLDGTAYRYEIRDDGLVYRLKWSAASPAPDLVIRELEPAEPYAAAWTAVNAARPEETEGIVLFREDFVPAAFLPCANASAVDAASASPGGRVIALLKTRRGEIEFLALPERKGLGTIYAFGPVLWNDAASGSAFVRDGRKIAFTMKPEP